MTSAESPQVTVETTQQGDQVVAIVAGEVDAASADAFEQELMPAVANTTSVVLNLAGVSFMDSSGLRALVSIHADVASRGGIIELSESSAAVDRLLAVTGLDELFTRPT